MRRWLLISLFGMTAFGTVWAAAAALTVNSSSLAAGNGTVTSCAGSAVTVGPWTTAYASGVPGYAVSSVSISIVTGDATACNGKTLSVTLFNGSNTSLGSGSTTVATGTTTYNVTISGSPSAAAVTGTAVAIG